MSAYGPAMSPASIVSEHGNDISRLEMFGLIAEKTPAINVAADFNLRRRVI